MKVAGFTIVRNAIKYNYPIVEAIESVLPICDEFIIAVGNSDDGTLELMRSIKSDKIRIIETVWDDTLREGGKVLAEETNKAFKAISSDVNWCFYIQGDECIHENYLPVVKKAMEDNLNSNKVEGLLFNYKHFYGSYDFYAISRNWYRKEIRVVRNLPGISSYKDAQGFRLDGRKLNAKQIDAEIYHYGWVKPPEGYTLKFRDFNKLWHSDEVVNKKFDATYVFEYDNAGKLHHFESSHPKVMQKRIDQVNWKFDLDPTKLKSKTKLKYKILDFIEKLTGYRLFEYKNYNKV